MSYLLSTVKCTTGDKDLSVYELKNSKYNNEPFPLMKKVL